MEEIEFLQEGAIAYINLNRPEKFNSFNRSMAMLLQQHLKKCRDDDSVRAVLLSGNGKAFSAGQDIAELTGENAISIDKILSEHFNPIVLLIQQMNKPVIAAVNGVAAGAGANLALCCDIVIASDSASFIQAFSKIGLIPDTGGTFFLPRLIGYQKASALMMTGEKVSAAEAERIGMIYKVIPEADFQAAAKKLVADMAAMPTQGLALCKQALQQSTANDLAQQLHLEDTLQRKAASSEDYAEGIAAFLQKRKPTFTGS